MRSIRKHTLFTLLLILVVCLLTACLYACSPKDDNENVETPTHTHTWGNWVADNEITHTHTCDCGEHETENHAWNSGVITKNATCKDTGIKTFTCSDCGRTKTETVEKLDEHTYGKWVSDDTNTHTHTCPVCNKTETENHHWNDGEITESATCKNAGIKTYTCSDCGRTKTETVEKLDEHTYGKWVSDNAATHTHTCPVCNKTETENHHWNDGEITETATCKNAGIKTYTCSDCGQTKTEVIEKSTVHTWGAWTMIDGETHTRVCSVCEKAETIGHTWDNGTITKQPNCKDTGIKTYTCTDCKHTRTETLDITNVHAWSKWTSVNYENHSRTCSVCNLTETQTHNLVGEVCGDCGYATVPATIQSVDNADVDFSASTVKMLVDKNTNSVNLSTAVKVSLNSTWKLYTADSSLIATKFANLTDGENTFLIVVSSSDGLYDNTYTLSIYKSFEVSIKYYNVYNSVIHTETADTGYEYTVSYIPEITGYTFNHWKLNDGQATAFVPFSETKLYADCTVNDYTFTLNPNGGTVSETEKQITFDGAYSLPVPEKVGHSFTGWYADNTKITDNSGASLTNSKFAAATEITAHWQINSYKLTVEYDDYYHGSVRGGGTYDYDTSVTVTATTKAGYTFIGWYNGDTLLDGNLSYTFAMPAENINYTAKWCKVTVESENTERGTVTALDGTYVAGETVTLTATTKEKYNSGIGTYTSPNRVFTGWYNGDALLSTDLNYTIKMPSEDTVFTAKWCEVTVNTVGDCGVTKLDATYITGENKEVIATTYLGYDWCGWYNGDTLLTADLSYTIVMPSEDTTYTAKWNVKPEMQIFSFSSSETTCHIHKLTDKTVEEVIIPDSVTLISDYTFSDCSGLTSVTIGNSVTTIGRYAFYNCSGLTSVTIGNGFTSIDSYAFSGCSELTSITIPDSVTSIGSSAFNECSGLTSITIGNGVTSIGSSAFRGCSGLTSITIGNGVTSIDSYAFSGCSELTSVTIPDSVTRIGIYAFEKCNSLRSIVIPENITFMGGDVSDRGYVSPFASNTVKNNNNVLVIYCKATKKPDSWNDYWHYGYPVVWDCDNNDKDANGYAYTIENGIRYCIKDDTATVYHHPETIQGNIVIPENITYNDFTYSVTSIGDSAFSDCTGLTSITIPDSVTSIGSFAFSGCTGLTSITIPDSVTSIGRSAFYGCSDTFKIYCETTEKPSGWNDNWNAKFYYLSGSYSYYTPIWDCKNK